MKWLNKKNKKIYKRKKPKKKMGDEKKEETSFTCSKCMNVVTGKNFKCPECDKDDD